MHYLHSRESKTRGRIRASKNAAIRLHRWLGIAAAIFWLIQALSGVTILFHWELEDVSVSRYSTPTDLDAVELRLDALAPSDSGERVTSVWTTAGLPDRYDVTIEDAAGMQTSVRLAGDGAVLRRKNKNEASFFGSAVSLHQRLLLGDFGGWIVGLSGILLITNILLGLRTAWPRPGKWRAALLVPRRGAKAARLRAFHRALGLAAAIPALLFICAGTALAFEHGVSDLLGVEAPSAPPVTPTGRPEIGFARAARSALETLDADSLTMVAMPTTEDATYRIRVLAPGEIRRAYGTSLVLINAETGQIRSVFPAAEAPASRSFVNALYAIHTGEALGLAGRIGAAVIALWLAAMVSLGILLWFTRRRLSSRRKPAAS